MLIRVLPTITLIRTKGPSCRSRFSGLRAAKTPIRSAAIPSETFEAKLAAGERRRFAFVRTKETTIKDPLGLSSTPCCHCERTPWRTSVASGIQRSGTLLDLYNKCFDAIDRISAAVDAQEVRFPSLKGTRELERQAGSEIFAALRHGQSLCGMCAPTVEAP